VEQTQFPLTLERIKAAYQKTGLKPIRGIWNGDTCVCPVVACYLADASSMEAAKANLQWIGDIRRFMANALGIDLTLLTMFIQGVDGRAIEPPTEGEAEAYEAGKAVRAHFFA
jgi:hypothetical protein